METNEVMRKEIFKIINNQIRANKPPETKLAFKRLTDLGYDDFVTKQLIGQCLAVELFGMLKHKKPFDEQRYIKNLNRLPKEPLDD